MRKLRGAFRKAGKRLTRVAVALLAAAAAMLAL
jgi:hypothetical protein